MESDGQHKCDLPKCGRSFAHQEDLDFHKERCGLVSIICRLCIRNGAAAGGYPLVCQADVDAHFEMVHPKVSQDSRILFTRQVCCTKSDEERTDTDADSTKSSEPEVKKAKLLAAVVKVNNEKYTTTTTTDTDTIDIDNDGPSFDDEFNRLKTFLLERDKEIAALKQEVSAGNSDKDFLERQLHNKEVELGRAKHEKGELRATLLDQHSRITSLEKKCLELEASNGELEKQVEVFKGRLGDDDSKLDEANRKLEDAQKEIKILEKSHAKKGSLLEQLQRELTYLEGAHHELAEKYAALSNESVRPKMQDYKLQAQYQAKLDELMRALDDSQQKRKAERRKFQDKEGELMTAIEMFKMDKAELERKNEALVFISTDGNESKLFNIFQAKAI